MIWKKVHIARLIMLCLVLISNSGWLYAQKKVDQIIPDEEKRKVIRAKKLYNEFKIYEGERIMKDLVREHPFEAYYHEALVQLQRQVLAQIRPAASAYESYSTALPKDSSFTEEDEEGNILYQHETKSANQAIPRKDSIEIEWNGLDTGPRKEDRIKGKKQADEEPVAMQEAVVTIDSSLIKDEVAEDGSAGNLKKEKSISLAERRANRAFEKKLKELADLANIPYDSYKNDFIQNCRRATLQVENVDSASSYLYEFEVDSLKKGEEPMDEAKEAFENGIDELYNHDPLVAKRSFERAISIYPAYYDAHLALGNTFFAIGKDSGAIKQYLKAGLLEPTKAEPHEKLSVFFYERGRYEEAAAACIEAIIIYPKQQYFQLLKRIVNKTGKEFKSQWLLREVYPLTTSKNYFEITAKEKTPWWHYQEVEADVHGYFDTAGIVRPNDKTKERYLEMYAWRHMLDDTKKELFPFARAMNKIGYLDCYVLVTCFHHDLYGQFADFAKSNKQKIRDYFYILINWEDKKFDKLRKEFEPKIKEPKKKLEEKATVPAKKEK